MKRLLLCLLAWSALAVLQAQTWSGVYVGGHIRRERPKTITTLKNSGFTYVLLFNVHVDTDGKLMTDGETICEGGEYVFQRTQPNYVNDIRSLKEHPTSIRHIEIVIGGWDNDSYDHIRDIIKAHPRDLEQTELYRNFKALKEAIPEIDGVNNDDEHCYDLTTALKFHEMMYDLGYVTSLAPYMNKNFWLQLATKLNRSRPGACQRVLIQCYDGGAYNNPADWHFGDIPLLAGRTNYQSDMNTSISQMQKWRDDCQVVGGFVWVYNDETWSLSSWAKEMNKVFRTSSNGVLTVFSKKDFQGDSFQLPEGEYRSGDLLAYGLTPSEMYSFELAEGYKVTLYRNTALTGASLELQESTADPGSRWRGFVKSLRVERIPDEVQSMAGERKESAAELYDLNGRRLQAEPLHGAYILRQGKASRIIMRK